MSNSKLKLEEEVHFIFSEGARFVQMLKEWAETKSPSEELKDGFLFEIDFPDKSGRKLHLGRTAMRRLENLAKLASARAGIDRQVDVLTVRKPLGGSLIRRFVLEGRPITVQHIERAMGEATRHASKKLQTITHFLPCHLMIAQQPTQFRLGPVTFLRRSEFRHSIARRLWKERTEHRGNWRIIRDATRYYKAFGWAAEVTVPACDAETSRAVAKRTVTAALNCLHLLFGAHHTREMTIGGPAIQRDKRGEVKIELEQLSFMASYGGPGAYGFTDDWQQLLEGEESQELLRLCGVALEAAVDPRLERPLSDRFLDAAHWFGEAVREGSPAAKVIKYVTALERMFMTNERDNITDVVSRRVASFCSDPAQSNDFERVEGEARRSYDLRSRLAHGSMSPRDAAVHEGVGLGAKLGRDALLNGLLGFNDKGLRQHGVSSKTVGKWFQSCVDRHSRLREHFSAEAQP